MKFAVGALASACVLAFASAASADVVLPDQTKVISYYGSSPTKYFGNSNTGDVIGKGFDTTGYSISESGNSLTIKYYTQFDGNELTAHYADLFLAVNNSDGAPAAWGFGVALGYQKAFGGEAAGLYALSGPSGYQTSQDIWHSKSGYTYGGAYITPANTAALVPTRVTGGLLETGWTVDANSQKVDSHYELTITLTAADSSTFSLLDGTNLDLLWGTGDCSNDAVFAEYTRPVKTPEPASIALLAGGLLALRRRRK